MARPVSADDIARSQAHRTPTPPSHAATTRVGDTDALVSRLALGGGPLGNLLGVVDDADADALVRAAIDLGVRLYDTAPVYGMGLAEQRLGRILRGVRRSDITVSTKVGRLLRADAPPDEELFHDGKPFFRETPAMNPIWDFSYAATRKSLEESLGRLGLDRADIVYLHEPPLRHLAQAASDGYRALRDMRAAGELGAVGVGWDRADLMADLVSDLELDCLLLASRYSLLDQTAIGDLLPRCLERKVAVVVGGVFNSGILADPAGAPTYDYLPADAEVRARVGRIHEICRRWKTPLTAAALQFPLAHPAVISVVVGMRSAQELHENAEMLALSIPGGLWTDLKRDGLIASQAPIPNAG